MNCDQVSFEGALRLRKRLGQRLAQLLEQNGWIQARLASAIAEHYERSMISHLEAQSSLHRTDCPAASRFRNSCLHTQLDPSYRGLI